MLFVLIVVIAGLLAVVGPWWTIAPVCFAVCWWKSTSASQAFWTPAMAGITLWMGYALYLHFNSGVDLATKVAGIFTAGVPALAAVPGIVLVLIIAVLVVGPVSGFAGLAGLAVRRFLNAPASP
ncbi:hypothetical protein JHJ32_10905 [Parapedobacter sp. ISTM3]|uniref:Uncharacterized protein n=1 Tax=Parapedobacter luteus TaxID=623280 RepID=A0A1T5B4A4_9SPHI|nr:MULTISPECIES: hypothetical protein [Parapedobacter]MBK1440496.1 hypothetical protein [Parapedobacter sp. ISTM3]SKB41790.1 hypothetical protein SAMN05660226_01320 [Parapedobacter luteus]